MTWALARAARAARMTTVAFIVISLKEDVCSKFCVSRGARDVESSRAEKRMSEGVRSGMGEHEKNEEAED